MKNFSFMRYYILHMLMGNRMIDIWRSNIQIAKIAICFSTSYYTSVQTKLWLFCHRISGDWSMSTLKVTDSRARTVIKRYRT